MLRAMAINPDGSTRDPNTFDNQDAERVRQIINSTGIMHDFLTINPDVNEEEPLGRIMIIPPAEGDQESRVTFGLNMLDGTQKPWTSGRSSNPDDSVVAYPISEMMRILAIESDPDLLLKINQKQNERTNKHEDAKKLERFKTGESIRKAKTFAEMGLNPKGGNQITSSQHASNAEVEAARRAIQGLSREEILRKTQQATATGRDNPDFDPHLTSLVRKAGQRMVGDDQGFEEIHSQLYGRQQQTQEASPEAVEYLRQNPHLKEYFKAKYGYLPEDLTGKEGALQGGPASNSIQNGRNLP